jgi:tyrosyl-tRNA synthetase
MAKVITNPNKIKEVLEKGVEEVFKKDDLFKEMKSGRRLRIKLGVDPTTADLHLGHAVALQKLRQFQDLGHQIIFLIGDFTAKIGDPSERDKTRPVLSDEKIKENAKTYLAQVSKILDIKKAEVRRNSEWLAGLKFDNIIKLCSAFTLAQMVQREGYKIRLKKKVPVGFQETLYPIMQAYDSVALKADVEIGGKDQLFNLLAGRQLQEFLKQKPQNILTLPLLIGIDGKQKMSQSLGNYIGIIEKPDQQYGKIMSIPDDLIIHYFENCTRVSLEEIQKIKKELKSKKLNPRDAKARLAREIVKIYHGKSAAIKGEKEFNRVFREKQAPLKLKSYKLQTKKLNILDLLTKTKLLPSKSEAKRLVDQRAVKLNNKIIIDWRAKIFIKKPAILQVGKRKFIKII